jgi:alpha-1,3-rhamnosyl/mannosyltransferase
MLDPEQCVSRSSDSDERVELLIDGVPLSSEPKGVGIYVYRILEQLSELHPGFRMTVLLKRSSREVRELLPKGVNVELVPWRNHLWHGLHVMPRFVKKIRARAVLVPYETPVGPLRAPFGMVCHDVPQILTNAQREGGKARGLSATAVRITDSLLLAPTLRRAAAVFANSKWVARELAARYRISPSRIRLAPCAPAADFEQLSRRVDIDRVRSELDAPEGYVLVIYTGDPRENLSTVPAVFDRVVSKGLPHQLVVVGVRDKQKRQVEELIEHYPWRRRVRIIPFVPAEQHERLAGIYTAASVYFDPSLQEGFGMQVVEAMACGTAVVCSDRGALSEVAGGAAVLVDPTDPTGLADSLISLLSDEAAARGCRQRARDRSRKFSWSVSAMRIHDALLDAAKASTTVKVSSS